MLNITGEGGEDKSHGSRCERSQRQRSSLHEVRLHRVGLLRTESSMVQSNDPNDCGSVSSLERVTNLLTSA